MAPAFSSSAIDCAREREKAVSEAQEKFSAERKQRGRNRALCVMDVQEGAPAELLLADLAAAADAGQVVLRTVAGPVVVVKDPVSTVPNAA